MNNHIIKDDEYTAIVNRALIHDANKWLEVCRKKTTRKQQKEASGAYSETAYDTAPMMLEKTLSKKGIEVDETLLTYLQYAGQETGHNSLKNFIEMDGKGGYRLRATLTLPEIIVHLADDMTHSPLPENDIQKLMDNGVEVDERAKTTVVTSFSDRMQLSYFNSRYPFLWTEGFGLKPEGGIELITDMSDKSADYLQHKKSYIRWQKIIARLCSEHLQRLIDPNSDIDHEKYIKQIAND